MLVMICNWKVSYRDGYTLRSIGLNISIAAIVLMLSNVIHTMLVNCVVRRISTVWNPNVGVIEDPWTEETRD
jgi:hypothetical protein